MAQDGSTSLAIQSENQTLTNLGDSPQRLNTINETHPLEQSPIKQIKTSAKSSKIFTLPPLNGDRLMNLSPRKSLSNTEHEVVHAVRSRESTCTVQSDLAYQEETPSSGEPSGDIATDTRSCRLFTMNSELAHNGQSHELSDSCFGSQTDSMSPSRGQSLKENSAVKEEEMDNDIQQTIKLNISGSTFEAKPITLMKLPGSRLAKLASCGTKDASYRPATDDYYFERNPAAFGDILEYYRSGELHLDQTGCGAVFKTELEFWGLDRSDISMCCWSRYDTFRATTKMYEELDKLFDDGTMSVKAPEQKSRGAKFHFYIFQTLENPSFSVGAKMFAAVSMIITLASIFTFVAETHYLFQQIRLSNGTLLPAPSPEVSVPAPTCCCSASISEHLTNHTPDVTKNGTHNETELEHSTHDEHHIDAHEAFHYLDFFTFAYFLAEIIIRLGFSYAKKKFFKSALNIVDVICLCAHFISIIEHTVSVDTSVENHEQDLYLIFILRSLRIMRVARIFKLFRHMTGFKVLVYTIVVSFYELLLIISFLFAGVLIFASIIHYAEEQTFPNIPFAIWWALVTMTTVGYGDVVPKSSMGYFIGALCVIAGILVIAFTVPVVVNNFTLYYALCKSRNSRLKMLEMGKSTQHVGASWKNKAINGKRDSHNLRAVDVAESFKKQIKSGF